MPHRPVPSPAHFRPRAWCAVGAVAAAFVPAFVPAAVVAQSFAIGVGAGADRGRVDCVAAFPCDRSGTHAKLTAAWRFAEPWDVQLAVFSGGRFRGGDPIPAGGTFGGTFRVDGVGLTAGRRWAFAPDWSAVGRLGAAAVRTRFAYADALAGDVSKTTLQPLAGVGLAYAVTPSLSLGVDVDVTRFKVHTRHGSLRTLGVAAQVSF